MSERLRWHPTLRVRLVLLASGIVTLVLALSVGVLLVGVRSILIGNAVDAARIRAVELADLAAAGTLPSRVATTGDEEALVQIVVAGEVVASSDNIEGEEPLPVPDPSAGRPWVRLVDDLPIGDGDGFRLVSMAVDTPGGGVVHIGLSTDDLEEAAEVGARVAAAGVPALVLVLAVLMWVLIGRALSPIEAIRREADDIRGDELRRRVPEPDAHDEVGRLARTVNRMLDRIEESAVVQRRFVGDAAHELRSPIASLRTQLETVRATRGVVDWDDVSGDLLDETLRMQGLTEQLLLLARLDGSTLEGQQHAVDMDEVVLQVVAGAVVRDGVRIDTAAVDPVQLPGEATLLAQAVRNLVENAARFAAGQVRVSLHADGTSAHLHVDDDGPGIAPVDRDIVFGRFIRLDEARARAGGGAGLGLAIAHDVVLAHAGTITVTDAPELGGARFTMTLPA